MDAYALRTTLQELIQAGFPHHSPSLVQAEISRMLKNLYVPSSSPTPDINSPNSTPSPANHTSSEPLNGISSPMEDTSTRLNLATFTQQLLEFVGPMLLGQVISDEIKILPNNHTIDITHTVSCAKSSATEATTADSQRPLANKLSYPKPSSETSSPNTFVRFPVISGGMHTLTINSDELETLLQLQAANVGSLDAETTQLPSGKRLHMTLREVSPTSSTERCLGYGDGVRTPLPEAKWRSP